MNLSGSIKKRGGARHGREEEGNQEGRKEGSQEGHEKEEEVTSLLLPAFSAPGLALSLGAGVSRRPLYPVLYCEQVAVVVLDPRPKVTARRLVE
jgi:hypothetical protein